MKIPFAEAALIVHRVDPPHRCMQIIEDDLAAVTIEMNELPVGTVVRCRASCGRFYLRSGDGTSTGSPLWVDAENVGTDGNPNWRKLEGARDKPDEEERR